MTQLKTRLLVTFLGLFTAWPLVHMALVAGFDVNPWKLGGYGMYSAPNFRPELRVAVRRSGDAGFTTLSNVDQALRDELVAFGRARFALGRLARPERVASLVFEAMPRVREMRVRVTELRIDAATAMLASRESEFAYSRGEELR